ncbi:hypothetical protein BH11MYX2_BH11MYX2_24080 [soil metagenome]
MTALSAMNDMSEPERRRAVYKLVREVVRAEDRAVEHVERELNRHRDVAPANAMSALGAHIETMRDRFTYVCEGYGISATRSRVRGVMTSIKQFVVSPSDAMRAYEFALDDLSQSINMVTGLRVLAKQDELFGIVRWRDDWLAARRTLVTSAIAQLQWYADRCGRDSNDLSRDY